MYIHRRTRTCKHYRQTHLLKSLFVVVSIRADTLLVASDRSNFELPYNFSRCVRELEENWFLVGVSLDSGVCFDIICVRMCVWCVVCGVCACVRACVCMDLCLPILTVPKKN